MRAPLRTLVVIVACALLAAGCGPERVRAQSRYFTVHHAVLFTDSAGRGAYSLQLQSIRNIPELSTVEIELERPAGRPWRREITVAAGQRRFEVDSPAFDGFDADQFYWIRVRLIGLDRFTILDRIRQRIQPTTPAGAAD